MKRFLLFLLFITPLFGFAQRGKSAEDSLYLDSLYANEVKHHMSFYYSWDWETRDMWTRYGIYEGGQDNYPNGVTRSWTVGGAWTWRITPHLYSIVAAEYSEKNVWSDSIPFSPGTQLMKYTGGDCFNFPFGIRYDYGRRFRVGVFAGGAFKIMFQRRNGFIRQFNTDVRAAVFIEYRWKKCWIKLMPIYRRDLFESFHQFHSNRAVSKGIQLEFTF